MAAATGSLGLSAPTVSAYGELAPYDFWDRRLTILQLGDSHTAADFFTGRVRERLQQAFGTGGEAILAPGRPHIGVRSSLFSADATSDWTYESFLHKRRPQARAYFRLQRGRPSRRGDADVQVAQRPRL